jgi:hypothetical protein
LKAAPPTKFRTVPIPASLREPLCWLKLVGQLSCDIRRAGHLSWPKCMEPRRRPAYGRTNRVTMRHGVRQSDKGSAWLRRLFR